MQLSGTGNQPTLAYIHKVNVEVGGYHYETEVAFIPRDKLPRPALVGHHGFFDRFVCQFDNKNGLTSLSFDYNEKDGSVVLPE